MLMKKLFLFILLVFMSKFLFGQKTNPNSGVPKDTIVYLSPEKEVFDTANVYAVVADINQPLTVQKYRVITKVWIYKDSHQTIASQELERVVGENVVKIPNWKKRTLWIIKEDEF